MAQVTKFIFGRNYMLFGVSDGGSVNYYIANGLDDVEGDGSRDVDVWSQALSSSVRRLVDIGTSPLRYAAADQACDIYLPDIDIGLSGACQFEGTVYSMSPKTCADFVHPDDIRQYVGLSGPVGDSTHRYDLCCDRSINSYLYKDVTDVICSSDFSEYADYDGFVRLQQQLEYLQKYVSDRFYSVSKSFYGGIDSSAALSGVTYEKYVEAAESMGVKMTPEDRRYAKLVVDEYLEQLASPEFNGSLSWRRQSKLLYSVFCRLVGKYLNASTVTQIFSDIDDVLMETYEDVLYTENTEKYKASSASVNDVNLNTDITYSFADTFAAAKQTTVADSPDIQSSYAQSLKSYFQSCINWCEKLEISAANVSDKVFKGIAASQLNDELKKIQEKFSEQNVYVKSITEYAIIKSMAGCCNCGSWGSSVKKSINANVQTLFRLYDYYVQLYGMSKDFFKNEFSPTLSSLDTKTPYSLVGGDGRVECAARVMYICSKSKSVAADGQTVTGYTCQTVRGGTKVFYCDNFDIKGAFKELCGAIDFDTIRYRTATSENFNERTYIKQGTLRVVTEVAQGHVLWKRYTDDGTWDVSAETALSDAFAYVCGNDDRLCAEASYDVTFPEESSQWFCDSYVNITSSDLSVPQTNPKSQFFYVRGFLEHDVDQDNIVTPIKDSYQNVFGQMSAYPYVGSNANGKCGTSSGKTSQKNLCALCQVARSYTDSSVNAFEPFTGTSKKAIDMYKYGGDYDVRICCLYPPGSKYNEELQLKDTTISASKKSAYKNFYDMLGQDQYVTLSSTDPQYKQIIAELTSGSQTVLENVNTITLYDILSSYAANYRDEKGQSAPKLPVVPNVIATDEDAEKLKDIRISALLSYTNNISDYIGIPLTSMLKGQLRDTQRLDDMLPTFMQYSKNGNNTLWQIYRNTDETGQLEEFTKKSVSKAQKDERIMTLADMSLGNLIDERDYSLSTGYFTTKGVWKNNPSLTADTRGKAIYTKLANFPLYDVLPTDGLDTEAWIGKRKRLRAPNSDGEYMEVADITPHEFAKYDQSVIVAQYDDGKNITGFQPTESTYCYDGRIYQQMTVAAPNAVTYYMIRVNGSSVGVLSSLSAQTDEDGNLTAYKAYYTDRMPYGIAVDEDSGATYAFGCAEVDATNVRYQNWDGSAGKYASAYSMDGGFIYDIDSDQVTSAYGYEREDIKGGTATFLKYDLPDGTDIQTGIPYNGPVYINNELGEPEYEDKTWFGSLIGAIPYGALSSATSYEATVSKVFYKDVLQKYLERADYKDSGKNSTTEYAVMRFDDLLLNNSMAFQPGSDPVSNWMELQFSSSDKASPLYYLMSDNGFLISVNMSGDDMGQVITREYAESTYGKLVGYNITNTSQKGYIYPLQNTVGSVYNPSLGIAATETNKKNRFIYNWDTGKFDLITTKINADDAKGYWLTFGHNGNSVHPGTRKPLYMNVAELTSDVDYMTTAAGYLCADAKYATETNIPVYLDETSKKEGESDIPNYVAGYTLGFLFDVVNKKYRTDKDGTWSSPGALSGILGIDVDKTTVKYYNKYKTITTVVKDWTQFFNCNKNDITASYDWIVSDGTYAYSDRVQLSHKLKDGLYTINGLTSDTIPLGWQENPSELTVSDSRFRLFGSVMHEANKWATLSVNVDASYQGTLTLYINSYAENSRDYTVAYNQGYVPTGFPGSEIFTSTKNRQYNPNVDDITKSVAWQPASYNMSGPNLKLICISYGKDVNLDLDFDSGYLALPLTGTTTFSVSADGNRLLTSLNYDSANRIITAGYTQISLGSGERLEIKSEGSDENRVYSYKIVKTETLDEIDKSSPLATVKFDFLNDTGKTAVWNVNGPSGTGMKTVTATNYACVSDDPIYIYSAEENKYLLRIDIDGTGQSVPTYSYPPANFPTPRETLADGTLRVVSAGYQWDSAAGRNELVYYFNGVSDPVAYYPKERNICAISCWVPMTGYRAASAPCQLTKYIDQLSAGVDAIFGKKTNGYPDPAQTTFDLFGGTVTKTEATNLQIWNRVQSKNLEKCFVDPDFTLGAPLWQVLSANVKRISDLDELLAHQPPPRKTLSELIDERIQPKPALKSVFDQPFYVYAAAYESVLLPSIDVKTGTIDLCRTYQPVIRVYCSYSRRKTWIKFDENFNADQSEVEDGDATVQNQNSIRDILQNGWVYLPSNQQVAGEIDDALDASQLAYNEGSTYRKWTANIIQIWVKNSIQVERLRKSAELKYLPVSFDFNEANPQSWVNLSSYKYPDGVSVLDPLLYEVNPTLPDESRGQNPVEIVRLVNTLSAEVRAGKRNLMPGGGYEELADDPHPMITWYDTKGGTEHQINAEISVVPAYNAKKLKNSKYWLYYNVASLRYRLDDYQQQVRADLSAHSTLILRLYRNYNYLYNIVVESLAQYYSNGFVRDRMYNFLSSIYLELAEDLDMNTDAYEYEVYDGEGNVVSVVDDAVYVDNSKVSYLMDALESKYAAKYGEDQEGADAMRSSLQSSVISAYYASLPDKTMSSEAALDRTVNAVVDGAVTEANVSSYAGSGYADQANSNVLARMAVEAVKQYRGAFSQDLDLSRQRRMLTEKFNYYSDQFSFSDAQISALKTPVLVYNVNNDGAYVSDLYSGYDITCRLSSVGEPASGTERQLSDCGYEGAFVSSVTPTSDGRLVYGILSGQSLITTFKYASTTRDVDSHGCQVYMISSYVPERYAQMSTFSEYLLHNYSEVSDGVYFDLKDEIVDNMTEIVLSSVLAVWKRLKEEDSDSFEFTSYYDYYMSKLQGQLQQSSLVDVPDDGIDYDADLRWDKVKNGRTSSGGVSPEYTLFNQNAKSSAVKSVPSMVSAFKSVEMLAFFKKNVHRYIQSIMDQGYLRDGLNHINNALIREIAAQLTAKLAQNQLYQRRALSVVFGQFAEEYYTNVLGYSSDIFDSKFRRRVKSAVQSGSYSNYVGLKSRLKEVIEQNVREINSGFYAEVTSVVRSSYDKALDAAFAQSSAYLDIGAMIGSDMVKAGVAEYVSKNLNTYDYADDALCACAAVEKASQPAVAALSAWLSGSIDSKIRRQARTVIDGVDPVCAGTSWSSDDRMRAALADAYAENREQAAEYVVQAFSGTLDRMNGSLSSQYNQAARGIIDSHPDLLSAQQVMSDVVRIGSVLSGVQYNYLVETPLNRYGDMLRRGVVDVNAAVTKVPYDQNYSISTDGTNFYNFRDYDGVYACGNTLYMRYKPKLNYTVQSSEQLCYSGINVSCLLLCSSTAADDAANADHIEVLKTMDSGQIAKASHKSNVYSVTIDGTGLTDELTKAIIRNKVTNIVGSLMPANTQLYDIKVES